MKHRDQVLRAYFEGRDWDRNSEYALKRQLVLNSAELLPDYPYVIEDEWEVESSRADKGRGDLVFTDGESRFAIVEVKWIDLEGIGRFGKTKRKSNREKRRTVEQQGLNYAINYLDILAQSAAVVHQVEAYKFTNEHSLPQRLDMTEPD